MAGFAFDKPLTWIVILVIVLLIFGAGKLPEIGRSFGKSIKEFKTETQAGLNDTTPSPVIEPKVKPSEALNSSDTEFTIRRTIRRLEDGTEEVTEERVPSRKA